MRVGAFLKYGPQAASTRQRLLQYIPTLAKNGFEVETHALLDNDYVRALEIGSRFPRHRVMAAYARRMAELSRAGRYDLIWIYAELFPYLPAPFERLAFASGKPVLYDFDDAFFHQYDDAAGLPARLLLSGKLQPLLSGAAACLCGNSYLQAYAARFCSTSVVLPTVVDTDAYVPRATSPAHRPLVVGWIGSPSTWPYVKTLLPVLKSVTEATGARVRLVGAGAPAKRTGFEALEHLDWCQTREVGDVQGMDIGIMPVPDEPWSRGKSGYKLIQYGACGLPVVASPVGVNAEIVVDGSTGLLATSAEDWRRSLERLLSDRALRARMGAAGRERVVSHYSLAVHAPRLVEVFRQAAEANKQQRQKASAQK